MTRFIALALVCIGVNALGQSKALVLDEQTVVALVRSRAPSVMASRSRGEKARAARVGAGAPSANPNLAASAGPRIIAGVPALDVALLLSVPFDVSGLPSRRAAVADEYARVADAGTRRAEWLAIGETLELWVRTGVAADRLQLEEQRVRLDAERLRSARVRRAAGAVGDGDIALALLLEAEGKARHEVAAAEHQALVTELRFALGLAREEFIAPVSVAPAGSIAELPALLDTLQRHPELVLAKASVDAAAKETALQRGLGVPLPRVTLTGERSPEYVARIGFDIALPVFQRNQTQTAIAEAREQTGAFILGLLGQRLEAEVRAAYSRLLGARAAYNALQAALSSIDDAEHLTSRAYELGQIPLAQVVAVHRETAAARSALLDAKAAALRAQIVTQLASGSLL